MSGGVVAVRKELAGWELYWVELVVLGEEAESQSAALLAEAEARLSAQVRLESLAEQAAVAAMRRLFKAAGCDPGRYRPSSEALARRVLKGESLPAIHPLVAINNALSIELLVPSCVMAAGTVKPPLALRAGRAGEVLDSMRGPLDLEGKPLLADAEGPFGTPITDSHRVKIQPGTDRGLLVAYLPAGVVSEEVAAATLGRLLERVPAVKAQPPGDLA